MPWMETCAMDERIRFVLEATVPGVVMTEVCGRFGISRKTGYKWLERYREEGLRGLFDRSRAPSRHPQALSVELAEVIIALKRSYPYWGPRKLRAYLMMAAPEVSWPAASTIGDLLVRHGLVRSRRRRRRVPPMTGPFAACVDPNDVWCADFKGWFRTGDGCRCDPLTVSDAVSRYALVSRAVERADGAHVEPELDAAFREYGLPWTLRTDNGPPFATRGVAGLSRLAVWLLKLGVRPERITPGKPQENGRHERFHRTLNEETASPPAATVLDQQRRFDEFRRIYNDLRPHEALGQRPPASVYVPSSRPMPSRLREPVYPDTMDIRRVRSRGEIKWHGERVFLSEVLGGEIVGVAEDAAAKGWVIHFADLPIARLVKRGGRPIIRPCRDTRGFVDDETPSPTTPQAQHPHDET